MKKGSREWKVRCVPDTPENKASWKEVFQGACNKSAPPIGANDKVAGEAFMAVSLQYHDPVLFSNIIFLYDFTIGLRCYQR